MTYTFLRVRFTYSVHIILDVDTQKYFTKAETFYSSDWLGLWSHSIEFQIKTFTLQKITDLSHTSRFNRPTLTEDIRRFEPESEEISTFSHE